MTTNPQKQTSAAGEAAHTPTPWESEVFNGNTRIFRANAGIAVTCGCNGRANAAFIVRACNGWNDINALRARLIELEGAK